MRCAKFAGIGSPTLTMSMKVVSTFPTSTTVEKAHVRLVHTGEVLTGKRRKGAHAQGTAVRQKKVDNGLPILKKYGKIWKLEQTSTKFQYVNQSVNQSVSASSHLDIHLSHGRILHGTRRTPRRFPRAAEAALGRVQVATVLLQAAQVEPNLEATGLVPNVGSKMARKSTGFEPLFKNVVS